ncbi:Odorant receptor Or2 [Melipona quadrifasciata]|uniref:Odorant receptor Or2 n=1 Tax=Melipona quadrifasciata TaxID=166423 RepID=A0A0M8ZT05_9HYME|nr:Odorant receptor Or2 [Melipona quadrifasciata]
MTQDGKEYLALRAPSWTPDLLKPKEGEPRRSDFPSKPESFRLPIAKLDSHDIKLPREDKPLILSAAAPTARSAIFKFLLIGSMALLFMFTYGCDGVIEHSEKVALGAYSALWTIMPMNKSGRMLRNDLLLVIERSRRVCCLTANGFFPISLETYTKILSLYHVGVCYLCFDNILCIINLHTAGQFRILQYRFANMCNTNDLEKFHQVSGKWSYSMYKYRRLKTYIQQHQMLIGCDTLIRDSSNVGIAVYGSLWSLLPMDKYGKMLRRDMMLVILRSKTPCCLTASGFFIVSLETYTKVMSALHTGICFCCFDNLLCILTLHVAGQFKILQNRLETIFGNFSEEKSFETYEEFKECIIYHHLLITYVEKLECVFCFPLMASEELVKKYLFLSYAISGVVQVYMITRICDDIMEESSSVGNALYNCNWEKTSYIMFNKLRKDMIVVMIRTKYPCYLTAAKFFPISLKSFTNNGIQGFSIICATEFLAFQVQLQGENTFHEVPKILQTMDHNGMFCHASRSGFLSDYTNMRCHCLMEESMNISLATYSGWWTILPMTETGRLIRKDINIIMMKSMRPCYLSAAGFFPVSLETSTALMSSTVSYFTLMRESSMRE